MAVPKSGHRKRSQRSLDRFEILCLDSTLSIINSLSTRTPPAAMLIPTKYAKTFVYCRSRFKPNVQHPFSKDLQLSFRWPTLYTVPIANNNTQVDRLVKRLDWASGIPLDGDQGPGTVEAKINAQGVEEVDGRLIVHHCSSCVFGTQQILW